MNKKISSIRNDEKIHKILAKAGIDSRRGSEELVASGRVSVNGRVVFLGERFDSNDQSLRIKVDGRDISLKSINNQICRVLAYNKRPGEVATRLDPEGRSTVFVRLPKLSVGRWIPVGRLDINTSGLLLFTNDGDLANKLMHPSSELSRNYLCRIFGEVTKKVIDTLKTGVELEDGFAKFETLAPRAGSTRTNEWFEVSLKEGRNREVRRLWESQELVVSRLIRNKFANIELPKGLPPGGWIDLSLEDINHLRTSVGLPKETKSFVRIETGLSNSEAKRRTNKEFSRIKRTIGKHYDSKQFARPKPDDYKDTTGIARKVDLVEKIRFKNKEKYIKKSTDNNDECFTLLDDRNVRRSFNNTNKSNVVRVEKYNSRPKNNFSSRNSFNKK